MPRKVKMRSMKKRFSKKSNLKKKRWSYKKRKTLKKRRRKTIKKKSMKGGTLTAAKMKEMLDRAIKILKKNHKKLDKKKCHALNQVFNNNIRNINNISEVVWGKQTTLSTVKMISLKDKNNEQQTIYDNLNEMVKKTISFITNMRKIEPYFFTDIGHDFRFDYNNETYFLEKDFYIGNNSIIFNILKQIHLRINDNDYIEYIENIFISHKQKKIKEYEQFLRDKINKMTDAIEYDQYSVKLIEQLNRMEEILNTYNEPGSADLLKELYEAKKKYEEKIDKRERDKKIIQERKENEETQNKFIKEFIYLNKELLKTIKNDPTEIDNFLKNTNLIIPTDYKKVPMGYLPSVRNAITEYFNQNTARESTDNELLYSGSMPLGFSGLSSQTQHSPDSTSIDFDLN